MESPPFDVSRIGDTIDDVDPLSLRPNDTRLDLTEWRLEVQRSLIATGTARATPIKVTISGVIWDGHHAVRVAADSNCSVSVKIVDESAAPGTYESIQDLPVE